LSRALYQALAQLVHLDEIGTHSLEHDLTVDIHHVPVPDPVVIDHAGHLGSGRKLAWLALRGKNLNLRESQIVQNNFRHVAERTPGMMLKYEQTVLGADALHLLLQRCGNFPRGAIRNDCDPLLRL